MITLHTVSQTKRRLAFAGAAIFDLITRGLAARFDVGHVLLGGQSEPSSALAMSAEYGLVVPAVGMSMLLSPFAYALGQIFVQAESHHVRFVSLAFFVGSFLTFTFAPALSFFLTLLAYLVLGSGMFGETRSAVVSPS